MPLMFHWARCYRAQTAGTAITVFALLFALVFILGFVPANRRRGDLTEPHGWRLAGRRPGIIVTWPGGDAYTAYTFIGMGPIEFFARLYTISVYTLVLPNLLRIFGGCAQGQLHHPGRLHPRQ